MHNIQINQINSYTCVCFIILGFLLREIDGGGCNLGYLSQTDPKGTLPPWLVNRVTQIFGPKVRYLQK